MVECQRGDVVEVVQGDLAYTAVVVQDDAVGLDTVVVCVVTDRPFKDPMSITALMFRPRLLRRRGRGREPVEIVLDKPQTIARMSISRVVQRVSRKQLDVIERGLAFLFALYDERITSAWR